MALRPTERSSALPYPEERSYLLEEDSDQEFDVMPVAAVPAFREDESFQPIRDLFGIDTPDQMTLLKQAQSLVVPTAVTCIVAAKFFSNLNPIHAAIMTASTGLIQTLSFAAVEALDLERSYYTFVITSKISLIATVAIQAYVMTQLLSVSVATFTIYALVSNLTQLSVNGLLNLARLVEMEIVRGGAREEMRRPPVHMHEYEPDEDPYYMMQGDSPPPLGDPYASEDYSRAPGGISRRQVGYLQQEPGAEDILNTESSDPDSDEELVRLEQPLRPRRRHRHGTSHQPAPTAPLPSRGDLRREL